VSITLAWAYEVNGGNVQSLPRSLAQIRFDLMRARIRAIRSVNSPRLRAVRLKFFSALGTRKIGEMRRGA
jgi:hypothetical protein